jgi:hypothetical protein
MNKELVESIVNNNRDGANKGFEETLATKIHEALEVRKVQIASDILGALSEAPLEPGSKPQANTKALMSKNVIANLRRAQQALRLNVNIQAAAAAHKDLQGLAAKNPKAPQYMLMRKLAANKAAALQSFASAGVPLGGALNAHPNDFSQALQRIKRFK